MTHLDHVRNIARDGFLSPRRYHHDQCPVIYADLKSAGLIALNRSSSGDGKFWHLTAKGVSLLTSNAVVDVLKAVAGGGNFSGNEGV